MHLFRGSRMPWLAFPFILALGYVLAGCSPPSTSNPTQPPVAQQIVIGSPQPGAIVSSPIQLSGSTALPPQAGVLVYKIFDAANNQIASSPFPVATGARPTPFSVQVLYTLPTDGMGRIEVIEMDTATGQVRAIASISIILTANADQEPTAFVPQPTSVLPSPTAFAPPTPVPPLPTTTAPTQTPAQSIMIDTPAQGTQVGSPVVLTGRAARYPFQGNLAYRVLDSAGRQIGNGYFPVSGGPGQPSSFNASLAFTPPLDGGQIRVDILDQDGVTNVIAASSSINLLVAPQPQAITIDSPSPGTAVGSPVVLTGRTIRYPYQGSLFYRIADVNGNQLGAGSFVVPGAPGQGITFTTSLTFTITQVVGPIRAELTDKNPATGTVFATATIDMVVLPPRTPPPASGQQIKIDTPAPGTLVGSPVVLTGSTFQFPPDGKLNYRVRDTSGHELGAGVIQVTSAAGGGSTFVASLTFTVQPSGGTIIVDIMQPGSTATASIELYVAPV